MNKALALSMLLALASFPAFALTQPTTQPSSTVGAQTPLADPDEQDNFDSSKDYNSGTSGREQSLLGGPNNGQQTYGFNSPGGSLAYGFNRGSQFQSSFSGR